MKNTSVFEKHFRSTAGNAANCFLLYRQKQDKKNYMLRFQQYEF